MPTRIKPKFKIHDEFKTDWLKFDIGKKKKHALKRYDQFTLKMLAVMDQVVPRLISRNFCYIKNTAGQKNLKSTGQKPQFHKNYSSRKWKISKKNFP